MANIMSMADIRNKPSRNGFDLSQRINFTAKAGELLPVWYQEILPGDKFRINLKSFLRTQPVNTAAQARMVEYYDFYFVPFNLLWNKFDTVVTQMSSNSQHAVSPDPSENKPLDSSFPHTTLSELDSFFSSLESKKNSFGFSRGKNMRRLSHMLGYGFGYPSDSESSPIANNLLVNIFPFLAYQKIYADYFRYTQWESSSPATFNVDYIKGNGDAELDLSSLSADKNFSMFDLRYCNYQKDLFHGVLPVAQYGSASVIPVSGGLTIKGDGFPSFKPVDSLPSSIHESFLGNNSVPDLSYLSYRTGDSSYRSVSWNDPALKAEADALSFNVPILALRQAEFLQKWKEVALSGEEDYKSQIQKHWGVSVSDFLSGQCRYLGGTSSQIGINEVLNNNITGDNAADIAGKGTSSLNGEISFDSSGQHGIIMCVYHILPILDYVTSGISPFLVKTDATDIAIPEFDQVGMESVKTFSLSNSIPSGSGYVYPTYLGYAPRYIDYKTAIDVSRGAFSSTLRPWILSFDDSSVRDSLLPQSDLPNNPNIENGLSLDFFKVNPRVVDNLFAVASDDTFDTDQFLCFSYFDVKAVRNLDVNGLPY